MTKLPKITIVMASYNSEKVIARSLQSIRKQDYPQDLIEILVYDGGSSDNTISIAEKFNATVRSNPETEPVAAKLKGYQQATGDLLIYVDTDEVYLNDQSMKNRAQLFNQNKGIHMAMSSGYSNPPGFPFINRYINSFGDPFSQFIYRVSKEASDSVEAFKKILQVDHETQNYVVFDMSVQTKNVLFENAAMGSTIRVAYFKKQFPELTDSRLGPVHFFYHMIEKSPKFAIFKNEPIEHYSADTLKTYLKKIKWRIINNIFYIEKMGKTGFTGRKNLSSHFFSNYKKYLYIPYSFLILPVLIDSLLISFKKRDLRFTVHLPLSLYTAGMITFYYCLKIVGIKKSLNAYGSSKTIAK